MLTKRKSVLLVGIYVLAGALSVEVGVRLFLHREILKEHRWGLHVADEVVGYRMEPGRAVAGRTINSLGYRGPEFSQTKKTGVFRIICSGNSVTFGEAASADSTTYPAVLESVINERGRYAERVEVLNAGVMGYTSYQCLLDLQERLLGFQPDLIILCVGWNDITFSKYIGWTRDMNWREPWHLWTLKDSYAFWLLNQRLFHIPHALRPLPLKAFRENLGAYFSLCSENGVEVALLIPPTMFSLSMTPSEEEKCKINFFAPGEKSLYLAYVSSMKAVASHHGVRTLDSGLSYEVVGKDSLIVDVCHPNDKGYKYMVDVVYSQVVDEVNNLIAKKAIVQPSD